MSRARKRADRIRAMIPLARVLADYGYEIVTGYDGEQQFSCDLHGDGSDSKPSARLYDDNTAYCVSIHDRVLTDFGWVKLSRLAQISDVAALDGASEWQVPTYLPRGVREVVRVQTSAGYEVTVTPDHEIEVLGRGWVQARDLKVKDILVAPKPKTLRFGPDTPLPVEDLNERMYGNHPRLNLPTQWSVELGETLGYVFGDGWVVPREYPASSVVGLTSSAEDVEDARAVFRHWQEWTSGRGCEAHRTDVSVVNDKEYVQDQYVFTLGNGGFCEFFQRLGVFKDLPANQRRLPDGIWQAPECGVRGFLRGVYGADGSAFFPKDKKGGRRKSAIVNLYSVSGPFLQDVQLLLLQFGIHSRVYPPANTKIKEGRRKGKPTHPCWYLQVGRGADVSLFRDRIGIANARKQAVLDAHIPTTRRVAPFKVEVTSVEAAGTVEVADLSMPVEHSFIAGGIKVHNCFACDRTRDAIEYVREKEGIEFWDAIKILEKRFNLPRLPWDDEDQAAWSERKSREIKAVDEVAEALDPHKTFEDDQKRVFRLLDGFTVDRDLPFRTLASLWEAYDKVVYLVFKEQLTEQAGRTALVQIRKRAKEKQKEAFA